VDYDHPSQLKILVLESFEDGKEHTSSEISENLGLEKEKASKQLGRYESQGLLKREEKANYDEEKKRPTRVFSYQITEKGRKRLKFLQSVEEVFRSSDFSWKRALEEVEL